MGRAQTKPIPDLALEPEKRSKRKLDELDTGRLAKHLVMFRPCEEVIAGLMVKARHAIPGLAETSEIIRIARYNPDFMLAIARTTRFDPHKPSGEGLICFLPLNLLGMQHLALGTFNAAKPDVRLLAKHKERPAGIYLWMVFAPGQLAAGVALMMERFTIEEYAGLPIYVRPATDDGQRFSEIVGFTRGIMIGEIEAPNVWVFSRKSHIPAYDSYEPGAAKNHVGITIARTFNDLMKVNAVRSAVYIGEQQCPYEEEYDGNDLSGTHLLAYLGDEPIGCIRLRFFAGFAKLERLAIRKEFRKSRAAFQLVAAGLALCQKKGYRKVLAHAQVRLINFWKRFGFHPVEGHKEFIFSDFDYFEVVADLEHENGAITIGTDPYIVIRPEGRWHVPGILERSAHRPVTRPSVGDGH